MKPFDTPAEPLGLDALDEYLMSDRSSPESMMLSDLDGFLTALAIGPELLGPSEWLPIVWGGEGPAFADAAEGQAVIGGILNHYNAILDAVADGSYAPILLADPDGTVISMDWAEGFVQAINWRPRAWAPLYESKAERHLLAPILAQLDEEDSESLLDLPFEMEEEFFDEPEDLLPPSVINIAGFWDRHGRARRAQTAAKKPGRNEPCPCGSGVKFKKCCGKNA